MLLDDGDVAEEISHQDQRGNPQQGAEDAEREKPQIIHAADARHERRERAEDRHEARDDDRLAAVLFVKLVRALQMFFIQKARCFTAEHARPDKAANPVISRISANRRGIHNRQQPLQVERSQRRKRARRKQQRIPRQKWKNHETGFAEQHNEQEQISHSAIIANDLAEVLIQMHEEINEAVQKFQERTLIDVRFRPGYED